MRSVKRRIKPTHIPDDTDSKEYRDDIYSKKYRDDLVESDSISAAEAGFMQGYEET